MLMLSMIVLCTVIIKKKNARCASSQPLPYVAGDSRLSADTPVTIAKVGFEPDTPQQPFD